MSAPPPFGSSYAYIPELDGLRAVSIVIVLLSHWGLGSVVPGGFGVTLFFGISGFIITRLLLAEWQAHGRIDLKAFYIRRAVRLFPAMLAFLLLSCLALLAAGLPPPGWSLLSGLFYMTNYERIWLEQGTGLETFPNPFHILWSLAIEEHFYLLFPLFLMLTLRRGRFLPWVTGLILASLAWRLLLRAACVPGGMWEGMTAVCGLDLENRFYLGTDTRLDAILFGCALAWMVARPAAWTRRLLQHPATLVLAGLLVLGSLLHRDPGFRDTWRYSVQSLAILLGLGALLFSPAAGWLRGLLRLPPLLLLGRMSYVIYLTHWLAICIACHWQGVPIVDAEQGFPPGWYLVCLPLTAALAAGFYWGLEKPVARLRHRMRPGGVAGAAQASPVT
jgi:peptidoglycan/LPS O-acetylase OafA/YrhL